MSEETCPDCGHPVGWDQMAGECPRNMQNFQSEACKERQVTWLKSQLSAATARASELESLLLSYTEEILRLKARNHLMDEICVAALVGLGPEEHDRLLDDLPGAARRVREAFAEIETLRERVAKAEMTSLNHINEEP